MPFETWYFQLFCKISKTSYSQYLIILNLRKVESFLKVLFLVKSYLQLQTTSPVLPASPKLSFVKKKMLNILLIIVEKSAPDTLWWNGNNGQKIYWVFYFSIAVVTSYNKLSCLNKFRILQFHRARVQHRSFFQFSHSVVSESLQPHGWQHSTIPCPWPTPRACSKSCPSRQWCHSTIWSSFVSFSSCLQAFLASGSFPMSQLFASGDQSIGASALVLPMSIED